MRWCQYKVRRLAAETVLSEAGAQSCFISLTVKQCVIVSQSMLAGEEGISAGSGRMAAIFSCVRVIVVLEFSGRHLYLVVPSAITYCLSMMAVKVASAVVARTISPAIKSGGALHLSEEASTGC